MADLITEISAVLAVVLGHLGAVAPGGTDVTLGMVALFAVVIGLAFGFYRKAKGRA